MSQSLSGALQWTIKPSTAENIVKISDSIDLEDDAVSSFILRFRRKLMLSDILKSDRNAYLATAKFMTNRIPREEFPNLQNVPLPDSRWALSVENGTELVDDCILPKVSYQESLLDKFLLNIFRKLVQREIKFVSKKDGILGLLEEGRYFKLSPEGQINDSVNQHQFVKSVLGGLLTPILPPFYRIFMAGIIPSAERGDPQWLVDGTETLLSKIPSIWSFKKELVPGKQIGPWFYAPLLTSAITPVFMNFLLGPCRINRRKDGKLGGMVVEKCKFLQVLYGVHISF